MSPDNSALPVLEQLLFALSAHTDVRVSEPACYALVNFALSHRQLVRSVARCPSFHIWLAVVVHSCAIRRDTTSSHSIGLCVCLPVLYAVPASKSGVAIENRPRSRAREQ